MPPDTNEDTGYEAELGNGDVIELTAADLIMLGIEIEEE